MGACGRQHKGFQHPLHTVIDLRQVCFDPGQLPLTLTQDHHLDQLVLVGKAAVGRGPADTGLTRHVFHGGTAQAELNE